jgi:hypothetical protein
MTTKRPTTRRRQIVDMILTAAVLLLILTGFVGSILALIFRPDRPAWQIAFDWFFVAATTAVVIVATWGIRRVLAEADDCADCQRTNTVDFVTDGDLEADYRHVADELGRHLARRESKIETNRIRQENGGW